MIDKASGGRAGPLLLAAFAVGFVAFPLRVVGGGEFLPGEPIDSGLNNFVLEHNTRYLSGRGGSFWSAPMFYPARGTSTWSDLHLGTLPVYALFRAVGLSPEEAFQAYFLVPFALNFASAAWALRRLGFAPAGTAAGALVFTFALPLAAQLTHVQLFPRFLVPPAVVFAWGFLRDPQRRALAAVAACWVGQLYLTVYIAYFLALLLAAGGVVAAVRFRRELPWDNLLRPGRAEWVARVRIAGAAVVVALPLVVFHAVGADPLHQDVLCARAPLPGSWLTPADTTGAHVWLNEATGLSERALGGEQQLFAGLLPLAAVAFALFTGVRAGPFGGPRSAAVVAAWSAVLLALLVTPYGAWWPYELALRLPGTGGIRAVGRIVLVLLFPAAVATAACADAFGRAAKLGRVPAVAGVVVLAAVVGDQWLAPTDGERAREWRVVRYSRTRAEARQVRLAEAIRQYPAPRLVYVFPSAAGKGTNARVALQVEAMRASQDLGVPCVNGYSGYIAPGWSAFRGYRDLFAWLTHTHQVPAEVIAGLVVVGEPEPDADPQYEARMRAAFPPRAVAPER